MKLGQFKTKQSTTQRLGLLLNERVFDVASLARVVAAAGSEVPLWLLEVDSTLAVIARGAEGLTAIRALSDEAETRALDANAEFSVAFDAVEFLPAVDAGKIIAIGRNYVDHAIEGGAEPPKSPLIFNKLPNSLSAHNAPIVLSELSSQVDYEAELAVVIGLRATRVSEAGALDHVLGYTLLNDVS